MSDNPRKADPEKLGDLLEHLATLNMKPQINGAWLTYYMEGIEERPRPISLERFFDGISEVGGHLAANLLNHPGEAAFYEFLQSLLQRDDVNDVKIGVSQIEISAQDPSSWVYADTVYLITNAEPEAIAAWFGEYAPDEVSAVPLEEQLYQHGFTPAPDGYQWVAAWWD